MCECYRQAQAAVVSNSRNKIHQTWPKPFSRALQREAKSGSEKFPPLLLLLGPSSSSSSPRSNPRLPRHFQTDLRPRPPLLSSRPKSAIVFGSCAHLSARGHFSQSPKFDDTIFKYFHLSFQGRGLLQVRRLPPEGRQRPPVQRE